MADDGKRSKAEWTLCDDGIEERGVPGGEGTAILPDRNPAETRNTGLHHKFLKFLRFLNKPRSPTALVREILEI